MTQRSNVRRLHEIEQALDSNKRERRKPEQDPKTGRFLTGNNGGPGRRKGSKSRFQEQFWRDLADAWEASGMEAIMRVITNDPATFLRVAAGMMPKEEDHKHEVRAIRWMTEAEYLASVQAPELKLD
jgi:hypothetical protein